MVEIESWKFNFQSQPSNAIARGTVLVLNPKHKHINKWEEIENEKTTDTESNPIAIVGSHGSPTQLYQV